MFQSSNKVRASAFVSRTTMQSMFTKNVSQGTNSNAVLDSDLRLIYLQIIDLSKLYSEGNFIELKTELTNEKYASLSISLGRLRSANAEYEMIRASTLSFLTGIKRANIQNTQLEDCINSYMIVKDRADILDDMDRLKQFISDLNTKANPNVFGDHSVTASVSALISPEYLLYIEEFGFPQDGVFDSEKLANINNKV